MKKKVILSAITFMFFHSLTAQELYSEDFENFIIGNVGTNSSGQTEGQGGWHTYSQQTYQHGTPYNDLFQIENTATNGKIIALLPHLYPYLSNSTYIDKDLNTVITNRTLGKDVIKIEVDFYTGQHAETAHSSEVWFGLNRNTFNTVAGFMFDSTTGELKGVHHDETATPLPKNNLSFLNDNNQPLILPFNTWIRCVVYADYINNEVVYEIPSLGISVTDNFYNDIDYPANIANHIPESFNANTINLVINDEDLPTYKFDNISVTALEQTSSTEKVLSNQFTLYPNPATDVFTIISQENKPIKQIKIYDLTGKLIANHSIENEIQIQLSVENLSSGTYFLQLLTNDEITAVQKLVIR